jgi:hypothetical protein
LLDISIHKVLTDIEYRAVSGVFRTIDPPPPLHPASVSSSPTKGGEGIGVYGLTDGRGRTDKKIIVEKPHEENKASGCVLRFRCDKRKAVYVFQLKRIP